MVSGTRLKILAHLSNFQGNFDDKWDIPREQSLPGIAEALGVVRSAVHKPLSSLEKDKLVISRNAQVSGKDSRRRKVIHITELGIDTIANINLPDKIKKYRIYGKIPKLTNLHGRTLEVSNISNLLSKKQNVVLNGLPGIGKSSLARNIAEVMMEKGWTLRWASCDNDTDNSALAKMWTNQSGMSSSKAIADAVDKPNNLLIIDEIQELNSRHINSANELISEISSTEATVLIVVRAPSPFDNLITFQNIRLEGLDFVDAIKILPQDLDSDLATKITKSLGGHPLALHLWSPDTKLPEENDAVQDYVKSTVLKKLSDQGIRTLDELSIAPIPLNPGELFSLNGTNELDDSAILKWQDDKLEVHHLIRNVRRSFFSEDESKNFHLEMAQKWSKRSGHRALRIEAHYRLNSGKAIDSEWLMSNFSELISKDSSSAAIIFEEAITKNDEVILREAASDIALERGEIDIANLHIEFLPSGLNKNLRLARLARIKGNIKLAEGLDSIVLDSLSPAEKIKNQISAVVRLHDDRLPGPMPKDLIKSLNNKIKLINLSKLPEENRNIASLSLNLIKNSIALETQDLHAAADSRNLLETQLGYDNRRLKIIDLRSRLAIRTNGSASVESIEAARVEIEKTDNLLDKLNLVHITLEASGSTYPDWLIKVHYEISQEYIREDLAAYRRISAQKWYWKGILEPDRKLSHWREALTKFRLSECNSAANEILKLISNLI